MWIQLILIGQGTRGTEELLGERGRGWSLCWLPQSAPSCCTYLALAKLAAGPICSLFNGHFPIHYGCCSFFLFCSVSLPPLNITYLLLFAAIYICCDSLVKGIFGLGNMDEILFFFRSLRLHTLVQPWAGYWVCDMLLWLLWLFWLAVRRL